MRNTVVTPRFKKDLKLLVKTNKFKKYADKLEDYINKLCTNEPLPPAAADKPMAKHSEREYQGCREFHAAPDTVVIYRLTDTEVYLIRIGQHNNLKLVEIFKEKDF